MRVLLRSFVALPLRCLSASAALAAMLCLSACAGMPTLSPSDLVKALPADLAQADADASQMVGDASGVHMKDPIAHQCYAGVQDFLASTAQSGSGGILPAMPAGAISTFQDARDAVKGVERITGGSGALPAQLVIACGPLWLDVQNDIARMATTLGGFHF